MIAWDHLYRMQQVKRVVERWNVSMSWILIVSEWYVHKVKQNMMSTTTRFHVSNMSAYGREYRWGKRELNFLLWSKRQLQHRIRWLVQLTIIIKDVSVIFVCSIFWEQWWGYCIFICDTVKKTCRGLIYNCCIYA